MTKQLMETPRNAAETLDEGLVLDAQNLHTYFHLDEGELKAVNGVDFQVGTRQMVGLIGESGCGKSVTAQSILRIIPRPGELVRGSILFRRKSGDVVDLAQIPADGDAIHHIRGGEISIIFQEPMTSFSPVHSIGNQIMEMILLHRTQDKKEANEIAVDLLDRVGIGNPRQRMKEYPHQLSGGMRQRAMIAMALSCHPRLLIADEPTTALDVTVQAQILDLLRELQAEQKMSVFYITHNLGVVAELCDQVYVMYLGRIVESGTVRQIFHNPQHPYTVNLLESIPQIGKKVDRLNAIEGNVPVPLNPPMTCGFFDRCKQSESGHCDHGLPALVKVEEGHYVRCFHFSDEEEV
jgi:oligopeptide/dipeptide ABC transporter ATP-binding protein